VRDHLRVVGAELLTVEPKERHRRQEANTFVAVAVRMIPDQPERVGSGESYNRGMIRKLASGKYRLYSRKRDPKTGKRRNLGTFASRAAAEKHERAVQFFKHH
jgi:hypothetical protein